MIDGNITCNSSKKKENKTKSRTLWVLHRKIGACERVLRKQTAKVSFLQDECDGKGGHHPEEVG